MTTAWSPSAVRTRAQPAARTPARAGRRRGRSRRTPAVRCRTAPLRRTLDRERRVSLFEQLLQRPARCGVRDDEHPLAVPAAPEVANERFNPGEDVRIALAARKGNVEMLLELELVHRRTAERAV